MLLVPDLAAKQLSCSFMSESVQAGWPFGLEQRWRELRDGACAGTTESCFLFGEAHQDHYRESQGAVVALFNARVSALSRLCCWAHDAISGAGLSLQHTPQLQAPSFQRPAVHV